jgi:transcriptional repressor NrdR
MKCPKCQQSSTKVYDTRITNTERFTRRRRKCLQCGYRFTTLEEPRVLDLYIEKRNGQTELFDQKKLETGIKKAFNKRKIDNNKVSQLVQNIIEELMSIDKNPIKSTKLGRIVLKKLRSIDEVAYICYWAMFGNFESTEDFTKLLKQFHN